MPLGDPKNERRSSMSDMVKLNIDGIDVEVPKGTTILQAAKQANIDIPTLCFLKEVNAIGDCRICIVEVERKKRICYILYSTSRRRNASTYSFEANYGGKKSNIRFNLVKSSKRLLNMY